MSRNNKGALTVEASIVMPIFLCVVISFIFIIKIVYVNEIINHAINETANEISGVSYLFTVSGVKTMDNTIAEGLNKKSERFESDYANLVEGFNTLNKPRGDGSSESIKKAGSTIKSATENPIVEIKSFLASMGKGVYNDAKTGLVLEPLTKILIKKYIKTPDTDVDDALKRLNVVGGFNGLDFSQSKLFPGGSDNIDIIVRYNVDLGLPLKILPDIYIMQRATVRAWLDGEGAVKETPSESKDTWALTPVERGNKIQADNGKNLPNNYPVICKFENGTATMIKSINLNDITYKKASNFKSKVNADIKKLSSFKGADYGGTKINENEIKSRQLLIVIPKGELGDSINTAIEVCKKQAGEKGVRLIIKQV